MNEPLDGDLYLNPQLARFYDLADRRRTDFDYCVAMAENAATVLDLGCGTGELATALASNRAVTGVDPAAAMLDIARRRDGAGNVTWIEADGRSVRLEARFDLVVLTGHVFQVFLTEADQMALLATVAAHLTPRGRFVLDTRNPDFPDRKERTRDETLRRVVHPQLGRIETWNQSAYDEVTGILTYTNGFHVLDTGQTHAGTAQIRYTPQADLAAMIDRAGLAPDQWLGDWHGGPCHPTAREIIAVGRLA